MAKSYIRRSVGLNAHLSPKYMYIIYAAGKLYYNYTLNSICFVRRNWFVYILAGKN